MRSTRGKPILGRRFTGDKELAESLGDALSAVEIHDRYAHSFHAYPGRLHPDAARDLIAMFPGQSVADPFCGGGTVLVEALVAGRTAFGSDLSPVALLVARTRCAILDDEQLTALRSTARKLTARARSATTEPPSELFRQVSDWYAPHVLCELEALRVGIAECPDPTRVWLEAVLSSILVKVSWRVSDTSRQRERHHRPPGTAAILFHKKARELARGLVALRDAVPEGTASVQFRSGDAREFFTPKPVELVVTSPPYPSTYDYLPLQQLRRSWLSVGPWMERDEMGSRRLWRDGGQQAHRTWRADTDAWTGACARALVPGGHMVVVIGDGAAPSRFIDAAEPTLAAAKSAGLTLLAAAHLDRQDHARELVRTEHIFAFERS